MLRAPRYGRLLDDFEPGDVYRHPWEVTVDEGMRALFSASFLDALPTYASRLAARAAGLRDRPVHPLFLLNLGVGFSVHDVSEQALANLAYIDARFPGACYPGDTLVASSRVLGKKPVSTGDKGVVHVRTRVENQDGVLVCSFERKALVRAGRAMLEASRAAEPAPASEEAGEVPRAPAELLALAGGAQRGRGFSHFFEDFEVGDVFAHEGGRTVSEAEPVQLATLFRNSHPLHVDERYCKVNSFARTRVVFGGLVLAWALALSSRDTAGNGVWDFGLDDGAHPSGVVAGDTLFAASKVLAKEAAGPGLGVVTLRIVGLKNASPRGVLERSGEEALFSPELGKAEGRVPEKVVEVTRSLLVRRREGGA